MRFKRQTMDAHEQQDISKVPPQLQPHVFKKGQSGNPGGRPKGSISLKEYARRMLSQMTEEEALEFMQGIDKKVIWEMSEGKPESKTDITSGGNEINPLLVKIIKHGDTDDGDTSGVSGTTG